MTSPSCSRTERRETVVIGGGLAGAAFATVLARAGRDVLLLERSPGPHDKVCGEFLSGEALHYLRALGVDAAGLGAAPVRRLRLHEGRQVAEVALPFAAAGLSRRALDEALLDVAARSGAEIRRGAPVLGLTAEPDGFALRLPGGGLRAGRAVLATGKHELRGHARAVPVPAAPCPAPARDEARFAPPAGKAGGWVGMKLHLRLKPPGLGDAIEVALFDGGYAGLQPVEGGRTNLCVAARGRDILEGARSWEGLRHLLSAAAPGLAARLAGAEPLHARPLAVAGIPYGWLHGPAPAGPPGLLRLGDQFAVIPSFCGDGMAMALHTGVAAAELWGGRAVMGAQGAAALHRVLRGDLLPPMRLARWLDGACRFAPARRAAVGAARAMPGLLVRAAAMTRVPAAALRGRSA